MLVKQGNEVFEIPAIQAVMRAMGVAAMKEQRIFDLINDSMPDRYKAKLNDRSYREGASKEGKTLSEYVRDRQKPKHKRQWS